MDVKVFDMESYGDDDLLVNFLAKHELEEHNDSKEFGQVYFAVLSPGATKGNHYHNRKVEWVAVVQGRVKLVVEDPKTKEKKEIILDANEKPLKKVRIGKGLAHVITNLLDSTSIFAEYSTTAFDPDDSDRVAYEVK